MEILFIIILTIYVISISQKVTRLEKTIELFRKLPQKPVSQTASTTPAPSLPVQNEEVPLSFPVPTPVTAQRIDEKIQQTSESFFDWLQKDWPIKLGALLILIGVGWFISYAFESNWIGPIGRVMLGFMAGSGVLAYSQYWIQKNKDQGVIVAALGGSLELASLWGAVNVYHFFGGEVAFIISGLIITYLAFVAYRYSSKSMAALALVLGGLVPVIIENASFSFTSVFIYLLILVAGTLWLVTITKWSMLSLLANLIIFAHSLPYLSRYTPEDPMHKLAFAFTFAAIFFIVPLIRHLKDKEMKPVDIASLFTNAIFILVWIASAAPEHIQSFMALLVGIMYMTGGYMVYLVIRKNEPVFSYATITTMMIISATAFELKGPTLFIAMTGILALYAILSAKILKDPIVAGKIGILEILPIVMSWGSFTSEKWLRLGSAGILHEDFFLLLTVLCALSGIAYYLYISRKDDENNTLEALLTLYTYLSTFYFYSLIWLVLHSIFDNQLTARIISLTIYSILGTMMYVYGKINERKRLQILGMVTIGLVGLRLIFFETSHMTIIGKTVTFIVIGIVFMSTMFFERMYGHKK